MISWIVNRLHVSASNREVIREIRKRLKREVRTRDKREVRHNALRDGIQLHNHNIIVYKAVMSGRFTMRCKAPCQYCGDE